MPSKSPKQARLMAAAAHDPSFAKKVGVPQSVAKEFNVADKKRGNLFSAITNASERQKTAATRVDDLFNRNIGDERYSQAMFGMGKGKVDPKAKPSIPYAKVSQARDLALEVQHERYQAAKRKK